jgi:2,3-bisphosphoglycerate-dependent phosphoglycerate mutase
MSADPSQDRRILFLFRHGETDWNREGRLQGHTDTPLNATGLAQAEALSHRLRPHRLEAVLSSDLARAATTGRIVAEALGVPLLTDAGLRETDVGQAEGLLWAEAKARFGAELSERWYADENVAFPGGETGSATRNRALAALRRCAETYPYRRIGVSTHGALVRQLMKHAMPPGATPVRAHNAVLFILDYDSVLERLAVIDDAELPEPYDPF